MRLLRTFAILLSIIIAPLSLAEDVFQASSLQVIVNEKSGVGTLSRKQVMSLFLGRARVFPNKNAARAFDHKVDSDIRKAFFEALTGKAISDIDAYWARLRYSGRASLPKEMNDSQAVLSEVMNNENAIAYVSGQDPEALAQKGIVVVYTLGKH